MIYKVLSNLKYNGKLYKKDKQVNLDEDVAKGLLLDGVIADPKKLKDEDEDVEDTNTEDKSTDTADADVDADADPEDKDDGLEALTVPKLKALATKENVEVTGNKADIVAAIRESRKSADDAENL